MSLIELYNSIESIKIAEAFDKIQAFSEGEASTKGRKSAAAL